MAEPSDPATDRAGLRAGARERLGFRRLAPGQERAIQAAVEGRDVLAIMPTGAGKSAIYQLAGEFRPGPTIVVSPLIALQRDQAMSIAEHSRLGAAAELNATLSGEATQVVLDRLCDGELEFLFLAPEQLHRDNVNRAVRAAGVSLVAVDEAHCVDSWGHDFRPEYGLLASWIDALGHPPVVALTATAAPPVRRAIVARLGLRQPDIVVEGFEREELFLAVDVFHDESAKRAACLDATLAAARGGGGLVYAATRRRSEALARDLRDGGLDAAVYHAGLSASKRAQVHDRFRSGETSVVVATSAFGMGIDRPDVRFVHHLDAPGSLDAYYQEVGRAGRDGRRADGRLFFAEHDLGLQRFFSSRRVGESPIRAVVDALRQQPGAPESELAEAARISTRRLAAVMNLLEGTEAVARATGSLQVPASEACGRALDADEAQLRLQRSRVEMVRAYSTTPRCRTRFVLRYLGQHSNASCGHCDRCAARDERAGDADETADLTDPPRVLHPTFGSGDLLEADGDRLLVLFDEYGYRTLDRSVVEQQGLLATADG